MGTEWNSGREPRSDIICLEGNGYRPSHKGDGYRVGGAMYTLNETEVHAVCYLVYESHNQDSRYNPLGEVCETVSAKYGTGGGNQPIVLKYEESIRRKEIL